jgi:hypothetical protein
MAKYYNFSTNFLNLVAQVIWQVRLPTITPLKKQLLHWCVGTNSLNVINLCLTEFPFVNQYRHIYDLIEKGLECKSCFLNEEAARIIINITKMGDFDDIASIYHEYHSIFTGLMNRIINTTQP